MYKLFASFLWGANCIVHAEVSFCSDYDILYCNEKFFLSKNISATAKTFFFSKDESYIARKHFFFFESISDRSENIFPFVKTCYTAAKTFLTDADRLVSIYKISIGKLRQEETTDIIYVYDLENIFPCATL